MSEENKTVIDTWDLQGKVAWLKTLDTKKLQLDLDTALGILSASLASEIAFRRDNGAYIGSLSNDCRTVQAIEAELMSRAEGKNAEQRKAWVEAQRKIPDSEIVKALAIQTKVTFDYENIRANVEMAKHKIEALETIIRLKTAQINLLSGEK